MLYTEPNLENARVNLTKISAYKVGQADTRVCLGQSRLIPVTPGINYGMIGISLHIHFQKDLNFNDKLYGHFQ